MADNNKPHLFYGNGPHSRQLLQKIKDYNMTDNFKYHDVTDPMVQERLPQSYTTVPLMVVKGFDSALIGKEVFNWVEMQHCTNLESINIKSAQNPKFRVDPTIGKPISGHFSAIRDEDDKKVDPNSMYLEDVDKMITNNIHNKFKDKKISEEVHQQKLQQLMQSRNVELQNILEQNKIF